MENRKIEMSSICFGTTCENNIYLFYQKNAEHRYGPSFNPSFLPIYLPN